MRWRRATPHRVMANSLGRSCRADRAPTRRATRWARRGRQHRHRAHGRSGSTSSSVEGVCPANACSCAWSGPAAA